MRYNRTMAKAKKSVVSIKRAIQEVKRSVITPASLWSRRLKMQRKLYARHWIKNDAAYSGGYEDRTYTRTRDIKQESTVRIHDRYKKELIENLDNYIES